MKKIVLMMMGLILLLTGILACSCRDDDTIAEPEDE